MERGDSIHTHGCIYANQEFTRCKNHPNFLPHFGRLGRSLISLLSSLRHEAHPHLAKCRPKAKGVGKGCLPQQPYGSIYSENKRLECPYGLKGKLHLIKGSLVWLPLRRTWCYRSYHFLLHFHATSTTMPHTPPTITPSLVLSQKSETLARLASRWSKPLDVDACPHTIFIRSSVLRRKLTNLLPLGFVVQTKKPL
jgi:hypothetical protein